LQVVKGLGCEKFFDIFYILCYNINVRKIMKEVESMGFAYREDKLRVMPKTCRLGTINGKNVYPCSYKERFTHPCSSSATLLCLYDDENTLVCRDEFAFRKVGVLLPNGDVKFFNDNIIYMPPEARSIGAKKVEVKDTVKQESPLSVVDELDILMKEILKEVDGFFEGF
jgi:hypothetical protein